MGRKFDKMKLHLGIFILIALTILYYTLIDADFRKKHKHDPISDWIFGLTGISIVVFAIFELILFALDCIFNLNLY